MLNTQNLGLQVLDFNFSVWACSLNRSLIGMYSKQGLNGPNVKLIGISLGFVTLT